MGVRRHGFLLHTTLGMNSKHDLNPVAGVPSYSSCDKMGKPHTHHSDGRKMHEVFHRRRGERRFQLCPWVVDLADRSYHHRTKGLCFHH